MSHDEAPRRGPETGPKQVVIVGAGAIGSHVAAQVARTAGVRFLKLIDFDKYEARNLSAQDIMPSDVNKPKVQVQARKLRRINPAIVAQPICARVQDVPLGLLRADAIVAALDSRIARQYVNQAARRLGIPWVEAALDGSGLLVRVSVFVPGDAQCCLECAWEDRDYEALEQAYPCHTTPSSVAATNAPASLSAVAAGIAGIELKKLLDGDTEHMLSGRQLMIDFRSHTHYVTAVRCNARCRFDHQTWQIERLSASPGSLTVMQAMRLATRHRGEEKCCALGMQGHYLVGMLFCPSCGQHAHGPLRLANRIPPALRACPACSGEMVARGFDMVQWLEPAMLGKRHGRRSLSSLGFLPGDVITIRGPEGERHFELGGQHQKAGARTRRQQPTAALAERISGRA